MLMTYVSRHRNPGEGAATFASRRLHNFSRSLPVQVTRSRLSPACLCVLLAAVFHLFFI